MKNTNSSQLEFFSQEDTGEGIPAANTQTLLTHMRRHEKAVLLIIGFVIIGVISFSLGVEKGRRGAMRHTISSLTLASHAVRIPDDSQRNAPKIQGEPAAQKNSEVKTEAQTALASLKENTQNYTIQLACYQTKTNAQKEAQVLEKKGLSPFIISKGKYIILCVGNFPKKETAEPLLTKLKQRYQDCLIRRL